MPRFFFHITGHVIVPDEVGVELHGIGEALRRADRLEVDMRLRSSPEAEPIVVEITDQAGGLIPRQPVPFLWEQAS
jgi:hypothetical protein